jgi:hypothetical protein
MYYAMQHAACVSGAAKAVSHIFPNDSNTIKTAEKRTFGNNEKIERQEETPRLAQK